MATTSKQKAGTRGIGAAESVDFDALMRSDAPQRVINVRKMVKGHVANKRAFDGGIAKPSMKPAQENTQLRKQRKRNDQPIGIHAYTRERIYRRCLRSRAVLSSSGNVAIAACGLGTLGHRDSQKS